MTEKEIAEKFKNVEKIVCEADDLKNAHFVPNRLIEVKYDEKLTNGHLCDRLFEYYRKNPDLISIWVSEKDFRKRLLYYSYETVSGSCYFYVLEQGGMIPEEIDVVEPCWYREYIKKIKLHNKVVYANFYGCYNLEELELPNSIKEFYVRECKKLKKLVLPSNLTLEEIEDSFFADCELLDSINIPQTVKRLGMFAFKDCKSLKKIVLPEGLEIIDWNAFEDCTSLEEVVIPNSIKKIGRHVFNRCSKNIKITAPDFVDIDAIKTGLQWTIDGKITDGKEDVFTKIRKFISDYRGVDEQSITEDTKFLEDHFEWEIEENYYIKTDDRKWSKCKTVKDACEYFWTEFVKQR